MTKTKLSFPQSYLLNRAQQLANEVRNLTPKAGEIYGIYVSNHTHRTATSLANMGIGHIHSSNSNSGWFIIPAN
ncbi:hypothetical protein FQ330_03275 [Agrococcus sediminis]|uniref:Uncharacterized protein n=1 Tax=Agrococcus sediminis TaxID=2599924 RepID=A0A5M8QK70_9MICO|nr:hypothetical protein [Agrococcus sediminis]KAA6436439.1 hypothetical protein FQ330_03275 [Agrococcus sediminis]